MQELSANYRCLALDLRGHGASDKPEHGYSVHRLAKDVHEFLTVLKLEVVTLMGHSMGCSIIWAYWELFGAEHLAKLVMVDEAASVVSNPAWSSEELANAGGILPPEAITELCNAIAGADGEAARANLISGMLTPDCPAELKQWILTCNTQMPLNTLPHCSTTTVIRIGAASFPASTFQRWSSADASALCRGTVWNGLRTRFPVRDWKFLRQRKAGNILCFWKTRRS